VKFCIETSGTYLVFGGILEWFWLCVDIYVWKDYWWIHICL